MQEDPIKLVTDDQGFLDYNLTCFSLSDDINRKELDGANATTRSLRQLCRRTLYSW
jgi:hypothetical protein